MSEPIRELRQNQKDIYVTLDNHTAMMQEMSETLDKHTEMLTALQTNINSRFDTVDARLASIEHLFAELARYIRKTE